MNRLLTEGRRAFLRRVSGIQRGAECARYEPLLSALADGEASAEEVALLRPHMKTCLSCRAALREFRAAPERVASMVAPAALAASSNGGPLRSLFEALVGAAQHKTAPIGERLHAAAELATAQKLAAVAASAAALAGGGTAVDQLANHTGPPRVAQVQEPAQQREEEAPTDPSVPLPVPPASPPAANEQLVQPPASPPQPPPPPPEPDPATEFDPAAATAAPSSPSPPPSRPGDESFSAAAGVGGGSGAGGGGGNGEFAP